MDKQPANKIMLVSVGGAPAPLIASITKRRPEAILFFVSKSSRGVVKEKILPEVCRNLDRHPDTEFIVTPDEQDIGESAQTLLIEVPKSMAKLDQSDPWPAMVDYTGGTKTMSAALVWASSKFPCLFNYVGAIAPEDRDKNGLGVVRDGKEKMVQIQNPWDRLAYYEVHRAMDLFDAGQYANAAKLLGDITAKISDDDARAFSILDQVFQGYAAWDMFDHKTAARLLGKNHKPLIDIAEVERFYLPSLKDFAERTADNFEFLQGVKPLQLSRNMIWDLLANARRRARLENKFEDATARCYAAMEKAAKHELILKHGIDNAAASPSLIPDLLRGDYIKKYSTIDQTLKFGLVPSYNLLFSLGNPLGERFRSRPRVLDHLGQRNQSILGHGVQAIDQSKFDALFQDALHILKIDERNLPDFPRFRQ